MASAEVCTMWMIFQVSQVASPETFKLCYDGISVWICPPKLSDLKLWWMAKIRSCWTDQYHLPKYWIHHLNIAFQSRYLLYNTTGPYSACAVHGVGPSSDWYTDHVHNKEVTKEINMIKWWERMASAEVCTLWVIFRVSQVVWPETFKLCCDGISVWICPPPWSDLKLWRTAKFRRYWCDQHHLPKFVSITQILPSRVDFSFTTLRVPIVLVPYMEWDPVVTVTLTHAPDHNQTMFTIK